MPASTRKKAKEGRDPPTSPRTRRKSSVGDEEESPKKKEVAVKDATSDPPTEATTTTKPVSPRRSRRRAASKDPILAAISLEAVETPTKSKSRAERSNSGDSNLPEEGTPTPVTPSSPPSKKRKDKSKSSPSVTSAKRKTRSTSRDDQDDMELDSPPPSLPTKEITDNNEVAASTAGRGQQEESNNNSEEENNSSIEKPAPTVNVKVHRLRHLDYLPSQVLAMAASSDGKLAVARADGSYELKQVGKVQDYPNHFSPHMIPLAHIAGSPLVVAHSLCWVPTVKGNSCVAAGPDGTLWTVNFGKSQLQHRQNSGGGGVFALATCQNSALPIVVAACQDGSARLFRVSANGRLQDPPIYALPTSGSAILSVAWRCLRIQGDVHETVAFMAVADGTIRKYQLQLKMRDSEDLSVTKSSSVFRMTAESRGRRSATRIWCMAVLKDGTLVSGSSLGQVQFWNSETGTLDQSANQTDLKADVLQLAVNREETRIFASGVDSRVICLERRPGDPQWHFTTVQRPHTHDVKAMALVQADDNTQMETLISGGVDTKLCSYVVSDFVKRRPQVWYPWPSSSPISVSTTGLLSMQRSDQVEIYRLDDKESSVAKPSSHLLGEICIETKSNLVASTVSSNGKWLATSNASSLFVFQLQFSGDSVEPQKMKLPAGLERCCVVALHFHEDVLFVGDSSNKLHVVDLSKDDIAVSTVQVDDSEGVAQLPIHVLHTSKDGTYLAALRKTKIAGVVIFRRSGSAYEKYWAIQGLANERFAAASFLEGSEFAVATFENHIYIFDLVGKKLNPWSEQNGLPIKEWPMELTARKDIPLRLSVNPENLSQLLLASFGSFVVVNLKEAMPMHCRMLPESHVRKRQKPRTDDMPYSLSKSRQAAKLQKKRNHDPDTHSSIICLHYNSMLYLNYTGPNEMVVVEQPWLRVVSTFPDPLQRRVYGVN